MEAIRNHPGAELTQRWTEVEINRVYELLNLDTEEKRQQARGPYGPHKKSVQIHYEFGLSYNTCSSEDVVSRHSDVGDDAVGAGK